MATLDIDLPLTTDDGVTVVSSGTSWIPNTAGVYQSYSTNETSFDSRGVYVEPQATNYCTNYNAAPDASLTNVSVTGGTLSRTLDVANLAASGLANICSSGYVFQFVNGTGSDQTITIAGSTGGTLPVALSAFIMTSGVIEMQITGGEGNNQWTSPTKYRRIEQGDIIPDSADELQFIVPAGVTLKWVLNQMEAAAAGSNWGPTSPIVTAGSTAARGRTYVYYDLPAGMADDDVMVMVDIKTASPYQYGNSAVAVSSNGSTNRFDIQVPRARMINSGGGGTFATRLVYGKAFQRLGLHWNSSGTFAFGNGQKADASHANAGPCDLSSSRVHFGADRFGTATTSMAGWVRNFKFYSSIANDAEAADLTILEDEPTTISNIGTPFYGQDGRLWALQWGGSNFNAVVYSDNEGESWQQWATLSTPVNTTGTLQRDSNGNVYFASSGNLYRIDASTRTQTSVITWNTTAGTPSYTYLPWAWGEQADGTLYTAPYNTSSDNGNVWFYKSTDNGVNWTEYNIEDFFPGETSARHIHSLRVSPIDDNLYASYGDTDRGTFVSDDALSTATLMTGASGNDGPTDISFASDGTLFFTDTVGNTNYIDRQTGDTTINERIIAPRNVQTAPIYYGNVRGTELVTFHRNESFGTSDKNTILGVWSIPDGKDGILELTNVFQAADPALGETEATILSGDVYGRIPTWASSVFLSQLSGGTPVLYKYAAPFNEPATASGNGFLPSMHSGMSPQRRRRMRNARYRYLS